MASIPWRRRFRFEFERSGTTGYLRICLGVIMLYVARRWPYYSMDCYHSQFAIGVVPRRIEEGECIPVWSPLFRTFHSIHVRNS